MNTDNKELQTLLGATEYIPSYGDVMTYDDFLACCHCGGFINSDGFGHPAVGDKMNERIDVLPSKMIRGEYDTRYTHIVWFRIIQLIINV